MNAIAQFLKDLDLAFHLFACLFIRFRDDMLEQRTVAFNHLIQDFEVIGHGVHGVIYITTEQRAPRSF